MRRCGWGRTSTWRATRRGRASWPTRGGAGTEEVVVALNTDVEAQPLPELGTADAPGTRLVNLFDTNEVWTVSAQGRIPGQTLAGGSVKIFVAEERWEAPAPVVAGTFPTHDATNVAPEEPITLDFSEPMETNSVQRAFGTEPAAPGGVCVVADEEPCDVHAGRRRFSRAGRWCTSGWGKARKARGQGRV